MQISKNLQENVTMKAADAAETATEVNCGVQCPGNKSLEPYIGTVMTLEDATFTDEVILVEIA